MQDDHRLDSHCTEFADIPRSDGASPAVDEVLGGT
jgi:hypothetical protein